MNWLDKLKEGENRIDRMRSVRLLWKLLHPYDNINLNKAVEEYNELFGDDDNINVLKDGRVKREQTVIEWRTNVNNVLHKTIPCPICGRPLNYKKMKRCLFENPERFSALLYCYPTSVETLSDELNEEEFCGYYAGFYDQISKLVENADDIFKLRHLDGEI